MRNFKCSLCKDTGQIRTLGRVRTFRGREIQEEDASPCVCVLNRQMSEKFEKLGGVPDALPEDSIKAAKRYSMDTFSKLTDDEKKDKSPSKRFQHRSLIFTGSESCFFYIMKSYFLFFYKYQRFEYLEGLQVVQKYYVEQPDGSHRTLYDLGNFDLLVLSFTSRPNNSAMQEVVLEVVKNRAALGKPTWIYCPTIEGLRISKEFSPPMDKYLEVFDKCSVETKFNYKGYFEGTQSNPATSTKKVSKDIATDFK